MVHFHRIFDALRNLEPKGTLHSRPSSMAIPARIVDPAASRKRTHPAVLITLAGINCFLTIC